MQGYLSKKGYILKKENITNEELLQIKSDLTAKPLTDEKYYKINNDYPIYSETKNNIIIPKMYGIAKYGKPKKNMPSYSGKMWDSPIEFTGELYPEQIEPVNALFKACKEKGGGILSLGTGLGKTFLAINVVSKLKGKCLIVVNKIPLMNQWASEIGNFLPGAQVGFIQGQKNVSVENTDIVIAMLQSLARVDYPDTLFEDFNTVVFDECFPYDTHIITSNGNISIGQLYYKKEKGEQLPMVKTFNEITKQFEYKNILNVFRKQNDILVEINCGKINIRSTENHRYLTLQGWKEASQLTVDDYLMTNLDGYSKITKITKNIKNFEMSEYKQNYVFDLHVQDNHNYIVTLDNTQQNGFVVHNCHNLPSKIFSQVLSKLCSKYTIGLSATPTRSDGCEYVFKYHLGEIVYQSTDQREGLPPIIRLLKINSKDYKEISTVNKFTGQKQIQFTSMLSELVEMSKRNLLIIELIKDTLNKDPNHKILVLSDRRNHLQNLKSICDADLEVDFTSGLFLGSMKQKALNETIACKIIFASFACFSEGVSVKDLSILILCSPKKYIGHLKNSAKNESGKLNQIVGRIHRMKHTERNPVIIDLCDDFSVYRSQSNGRKVFYKGHFKNAIFQEQSIDLDLNDDVKIEYIKTKKEKTKKIEKELENNILNKLYIDD